ncbi:hypothetical protein EDB85DRAFT_2246563 [Lactarius pseudohatsudake]|nr:hypothetical protein EDB85DRAFT_2246563 [Lactarius pseudohatsudake]
MEAALAATCNKYLGSGGIPRRHQTHPAPKSHVPSETLRPLKLSLEELYAGTTKRMKVSQRNFDGTTEGKVLDHRAARLKRGHESPIPASRQTSSLWWRTSRMHVSREGDDLIAKIEIPLVDALTNESEAMRQLEHLDGRKLQMTLPPCCCFSDDEAMVATATRRWRVDNDETRDHNNGRRRRGDSDHEDNDHADDSDITVDNDIHGGGRDGDSDSDDGQWTMATKQRRPP